MNTILKRIIVTILTWEAKLVLKRHNPRIIAVTGSIGKTSTKDAIFAAVSPTLSIRKSEKSFNSELGVPLTILGLESGWNNPLKWITNIIEGLAVLLDRTYPQWLVLEVGADRPGDIRSIARWLRPDIAVITAVPKIPVHVEYFASPEHVLAEKRMLAEYLKPGGVLMVYGDEERVRNATTHFKGTTITYGFEEHNIVRGERVDTLYENNAPVGTSLRLSYAGNSLPVVLYGGLGKPRAYSALAAIAVATHMNIGTVEAAQHLAQWKPTPGRLRLVPGMHGSVIIDDTYNASPAATCAALDTLVSVSAHRRIALLGDMMELGKYSAEAHKEVGEYVAKNKIDILYTVGWRARALCEAARDWGMKEDQLRQYEHIEAERAGIECAREVQEGDVILVKGSQSVRMEKAVQALMLEPSRAPEYLVRQDDEWKKR